jgi:hypothetical protein
VASGLWVALVVPVFHYGFISDDYSLLVEDFHNPWYNSLDGMYRYLRNIVLRIMPRLFGLTPWPYHTLALAGFLATLILLFILVRKLGATVWGALGAVIIVETYPRNGILLFGFNWAQELAVASGILAAMVAWLEFRERNSKLAYGISLVCFAYALGFKETAVVFPALLLALDWYTLEARTLKAVFSKRVLFPYLGLAAIIFLYAGCVLLQKRGALIAPADDSTYRYSSLTGGLLAVVRDFVNLLRPFSRMIALRDLTWVDYALLGLAVTLIAWTARRTATIRTWLFVGVWVFLVVLPPSLFARTVNSERHMFLPMLGVAFAVALTIDYAVRLNRWAAPALALCLAAYSIAGVRHLMSVRTQWREATAEVQSFIGSVREFVSPSEIQSVTFINVPAALNNGLRGALLSVGYPDHMKLTGYGANPSVSDPVQDALVGAISACSGSVSVGETHRSLLWINGRMVDRTGACADNVIEHDRQVRPWAWLKL